MKNKVDELEVLADLINMNTAGDNEIQVVNYISELLGQYRINSEIICFNEKRANLIAEIGTGQKPVLAITGHADTVLVENEEDWGTSPFLATVIDGKMFGRGATDMKSGLAAAVLSMIRLKEQEANLKGTYRLYLTFGEETGELGAKELITKGYAQDVDALIVGEPSGIPIQPLKSSSQKNIDFFTGLGLKDDLKALIKQNIMDWEQHFIAIAHKGSICYTVTSHGKAAHSSIPAYGVNAIDGLLQFIYKQQEYFEQLGQFSNEILGAVTPVLTKIKGGEQANTVPEQASISVFIRTIPEKSNDSIIQDLNKLINETNEHSASNLELDIKFEHRPVCSSSESQLSQITEKWAKKSLQQSLPFVGIPGGTDASQFIRANSEMDVIIFGPGNITAHQVNEFVEINIYQKFIDIYEKVALEFLG